MNALATASAGLRATQAAIGVVSQNVANAGTAGYVKRTLTSLSSGIGNSGVATGTITRSFDAAALQQLRLETAGSAYTATRSDIAAQVDKLFGKPGSATALDGVINTFTQSLQTLAANPTSTAARGTVIDAASAVAGSINTIATGIQSLRSGIEARLGTETASANALLAGIASLNVKLQATTGDANRADILDQRDQQITQLASYFDVNSVEQRDGSVTVMTGSGITLVDHGTATSLRFDTRSTLDANSAYSADPSVRSVGTITATTPGGGTIDLGEPGLLRSGSIAAGIELRDTTLPQVQRQLDDLAAGLSSALTDKTVKGTVAGTAATTDLSGIQPGNTLTLPVTAPDGSVRNVVLIASNGATKGVDPGRTDDATAFAQTFDISGGPATYAAKIQDALNSLSSRANAAGYKNVPALTASGVGGTVTVTGTGGFSVAGATARITVPTSSTDLSTSYPQLALFVDGSGKSLFTGSFDVGAQRTGFAQRIAVNPVVTAKTAALTASGATDTTADSKRAQFIYDALTTTPQTFSSSSGIGGIAAPYAASVTGFAQDIIAAQGSAASSAATLASGQSIALSTAQGRFTQTAGVTVDEEMSNLIALQTAYTANARVLTAARDMLDALLRI